MTKKNKLLAKATKKLMSQMKTDSVAGGLYTDERNPFNDENLTEKFVWSKKIEKEGKKAVQKLTDKELQKEREEEMTRQRKNVRTEKREDEKRKDKRT